MKLDKYDRMFIAFICVIVTVFNIGTLCFAVEDFDYVSNCSINSEGNIVSNSSEQYKVFYIDVEPNSNYTLTFDTSFGGDNQPNRLFYVGFSDNVPTVGDSLNDFITLSTQKGQPLSYTFNTKGDYLIICVSTLYYVGDFNANYINLTYNGRGLVNVATDLAQNIGINQLWGVFESGIDFIGVVVLVAFGLFLVFLLIKKIIKGKSDF